MEEFQKSDQRFFLNLSFICAFNILTVLNHIVFDPTAAHPDASASKRKI
jgi:hypothetical protein